MWVVWHVIIIQSTFQMYLFLWLLLCDWLSTAYSITPISRSLTLPNRTCCYGICVVCLYFIVIYPYTRNCSTFFCMSVLNCLRIAHRFSPLVDLRIILCCFRLCFTWVSSLCATYSDLWFHWQLKLRCWHWKR